MERRVFLLGDGKIYNEVLIDKDFYCGGKKERRINMMKRIYQWDFFFLYRRMRLKGFVEGKDLTPIFSLD